MRLTLRQLQIFLEVARAGSTTAAAQALALSQSATSAGLNELEGVLETRLFDRVGKRLVLNDNGRLLLPQARQMLDAAATIESQFADVGAFKDIDLRIGASTTIGIYLLPTLIAAAAAAAGSISLKPNIMIANTADVAAAVANFEVDFGLIEGPCHEADLLVEPWIRDELIIVAAPHHAVLKGDPDAAVTKKALREAGWLLREAGSGTREAVEHALLPHLHSLRSNGEFGNSEAIKYAAAEGLGVACLSRWVVGDLIAMGRLVELNTSLPPLHRHFYLIHSKQKILSERLKSFLAFSREWRKQVAP
ncbi:MAG: LysR family transcriptional regulator [Massilia sp.]